MAADGGYGIHAAHAIDVMANRRAADGSGCGARMATIVRAGERVILRRLSLAR